MNFLEFDLQKLVNRLLLACQDNIYSNINNQSMINYIVLDITNQVCNTYELKENYENKPFGGQRSNPLEINKGC